MNDKLNKISSVGDYIHAIMNINDPDNNGKYQHWYRGHANKEWELVPKIQRNFNGESEELFRLERCYTNRFQAQAAQLPIKKPSLDDYCGWLSMMQHYGLPTRLLDWSRSPLIALYFAVSDTCMPDKDAIVWILKPQKLNELEKLEKPTEINGVQFSNSYIYNMSHNTIYTMVYTAFKRWHLSSNSEAITPEDRKFNHRFCALKDKIAACYPVVEDSRVYNQHSAFTVHNSQRKLTEYNNAGILSSIIIPAESKKDLLAELEACAITKSYIYPDLEHVARDVMLSLSNN